MNEPHRDPTVARALDRLPVPDHAPDFWDTLDARLDEADGITHLRPRPRRRQLTPLLAAAAAMILVLGVALVMVDQDDGDKVLTGNPTQTTQKEPATTVPPRAPTSTPDVTVNQWLDALGRGDEQTAAALVGPKSRRYIESLGGDVEGFMRESEEGYGGWGASSDRSTTEIDLGTVDGARTTIVVVTGTWRGEGEDGFRFDAIPAVLIGNEWKVEPVAFDPETGGRLEVIAPTRSDEGAEFSPLSPDGVISASAAGSGDFYFSLDDDEPAQVEGERAGGGVRATWDPPGEMSQQTHLLVIAYVDDETLTAFAGRFRVIG